MENTNIGIKEAMDQLAEIGATITRPTITTFCREGRIPAVRLGREWVIQQEYIDKAKDWRRGVKTLEELALETNGFAKLPEDVRKNCKRTILLRCADFLVPKQKYAELFVGPFISVEDVATVRTLLTTVVANYTPHDLVPIADAAKQTGYSAHVLKNMIKSETVRAVTINHNWYLQQSEINAVIDRKNNYVPLITIAEEICSGMTTAFDPAKGNHRATLTTYALQSSIAAFLVPESTLGLRQDKKYTYYVPVKIKEEVIEALTPFIRHYGLSADRIREFQKHEYWRMHPETSRMVMEFCEKKNDVAKAALMEIITSTLKTEITQAAKADIDRMFDYVEGSIAKIYVTILSEFLSYVQKNSDCSFGVSLRKRSALQKKKLNITPYSLDDYCILAVMTFNDGFRKKFDLVRKALEDPKLAYTWLRTSFFYTGMWRDSDIFYNIPVIYPGCSSEELKEKIQNGEFSEKEATRLSMLLEAAILAEKTPPHKTGKESLQLHISESLRPVIGLIYACNLVHTTGDHIKGYPVTAGNYRDLFGEIYTKVFGFQKISSRRANKSYADEITEITDRRTDQKHKVRGYLVAAFARSHVMANGSLPEVTSRYLQYKMDGYSLDDIMMQLWELGACSFAVNMMMETIYGDNYRWLTFMEQTNIVKESGLDAYAAEVVVTKLSDAYHVGEMMMKKIFADNTRKAGETVFTDAMTNIVDGYAAAKDEGMYCLQMAFKNNCVMPGCRHCLGCDFVIATRAALYTTFRILEDAYDRMRVAKTEATREMYMALIDRRYIPGILEILTISQTEYGMDVSEIRERTAMLISGKKGDHNDQSV